MASGRQYTIARKIALEKGTFAAFNSIGAGHFLQGTSFSLEAVAKHVGDLIDASLELDTLGNTIAMEEAKDQLENQQEEVEGISTTFFHINFSTSFQYQ